MKWGGGGGGGQFSFKTNCHHLTEMHYFIIAHFKVSVNWVQNECKTKFQNVTLTCATQ